MPDYIVGDMHKQIAAGLEAVERGDLRRLMILTPPRHGKSQLVSRHFPAWYMGRNPLKQIISVSATQGLVSDFGRDVRRIMQDNYYKAIFPDVTVAPDSSAKHRLHTNYGGIYIAAGVEAMITGRGAHILNIDDPLRDRAAADSETIRNAVWDWYTSTAYTRLMPSGAVIVTLTRWHEDDLAGRLLRSQENGGDQWHIIKLPAIDEQGDALWPERYDLDSLIDIKVNIGERDWNSLYQQDPRPPEGALFKVGQLTVSPTVPRMGRRVRAWDLAATAASNTHDPDWTAGVLMDAQPDGGFVIVDVVRFRGGPDEVEKAIINTAHQDGASVRIGLPQDPGQAGKAQVQYLTRKLAGYRVESSPETGDKATRAAPFASQVNVGNVMIIQPTRWAGPFLEELRNFPSGTHDDQVDAASRAFMMLGTNRIRVTQDLLSRI